MFAPINFGLPQVIYGPFFEEEATASAGTAVAYCAHVTLRSCAAVPSANPAVVIGGNAIELLVNWSDMSGTPRIPDSVQYQVFDKNAASVSSRVIVASVAASMTFGVAGSDLPANAESRRRLFIKLTGTFGANQHTAHVQVFVQKTFTFN